MEKGRYYIFEFDDSEDGIENKCLLLSSPNGTMFDSGSAIHINSTQNVFIRWARDWNENEKKYYDGFFKGVKITPTTITSKIDIRIIMNGLGLINNPITRQTEELNNFLVNIFSEFISKNKLI